MQTYTAASAPLQLLSRLCLQSLQLGLRLLELLGLGSEEARVVAASSSSSVSRTRSANPEIEGSCAIQAHPLGMPVNLAKASHLHYDL